MADNGAIVREFIQAWERKDVEGILSFFRDDAVYTNIPMDPPNVGKAMIRATVEGFVGMAEKVQFVVHHHAVNEKTGVVMNERTDRFLINGKWIELGVMGVFEFKDGKIAAWRDYFDLGQFQRQMAK
jgi:limonene-1,2-epoxide hydrolase